MKKIKIGNKFIYHGFDYNIYYKLVEENNLVGLKDLEDGDWFKQPIKVNDKNNISHDEWNEIAGNGLVSKMNIPYLGNYNDIIYIILIAILIGFFIGELAVTCN